MSLLHSVSLSLVDRWQWRSSSSLDPADPNLVGNQITVCFCWLGNGRSDVFLLRHADTIPTGKFQSGLLWLGREWRISCLLSVKGATPQGNQVTAACFCWTDDGKLALCLPLLTPPSQGIGVGHLLPWSRGGSWGGRSIPWLAPPRRGEGRGGGL